MLPSAVTLVHISRRLAEAVDGLSFDEPVTHVYNPLIYAAAAHEQYLERWGHRPKEVVFLGMNPGPWGMAQTGVPFGEVGHVRDWLGIDAPVGKPGEEHPKRPVQGLACTRSEVSGRRLWGWAKQRFGTPERFFERFFVANYCPLVFMEASGRNFTPDKLRSVERAPLIEHCDEALRELIGFLRPTLVVGVGTFAERRATAALGLARGDAGGTGCPRARAAEVGGTSLRTSLRVGRMLHPSPASPAANRGWAEAAERDLRSLGVDFSHRPH